MKIECSFCKQNFKTRPSNLKGKKTHCCSRVCSSALKRVLFTGVNNHQFGLKGELNPTYKSDIKITNYGYIKIRTANHPLADHAGFVLLHRLIMENYFLENDIEDYLVSIDNSKSKYLSKDHIVHHKDGNRLNNVLSNLEIMTLQQHSKDHFKEKEVKYSLEYKCNLIVGNKIKSTNSNNQLLKNHCKDAGLDILVNETGFIQAKTRKLLNTDLFVEIPEGHVGLIWSRSGLAVKNGIQIGAGCIDCGYTGEVKLLLFNNGEETFFYNKGDKLAQLLTIPILDSLYENKDNFNQEIDQGAPSRGIGGFGHTGV